MRKYVEILSEKSIKVLLVLVLVVAPLLNSIDIVAFASEHATMSSSTRTTLPVINFENDIPGVVSSSAVTRVQHEGSYVLNVNPLLGLATASHTWTLPLDNDVYDVSGQDIVEFNFDWWPDHSRPWQNSYEIRFLDGDNVLFGIGSTQSGNNPPHNVEIFYTAADGTPKAPNEILTANRETVVASVSRLAKHNVTVTLNLATGYAAFELYNLATGVSITRDSIALPSRNITDFHFGALRFGNWADGVGDPGWDNPDSDYGSKLDNVSISYSDYDGTALTVYPTAINLNTTTVNLEYGLGSEAALNQATISAIVQPINVHDNSLTWTISDADIAIISGANNESNVLVTPVTSGTTILTATSNAYATGGSLVSAEVVINVEYRPAFPEPERDHTSLLEAGWVYRFGSNFPLDNVWSFTGNPTPQSHREGTVDDPINHFMSFVVASQSGNRSIARELPKVVEGSQAYLTFDWLPGTVNIHGTSEDQNAYDIQIMDGARSVLSIRTGADGNNAQRVGLFTASEIPGFNQNSFDHPQVVDLSDLTNLPNWQNQWFTVGIDFDFHTQYATVIITNRGEATPILTEIISFDGTQLTDIRINGRRTATNNITLSGNGFDNMHFFTKDHYNDTIVSVLPPGFLRQPPVGSDGSIPQSWFKTIELGSIDDVNGIGLPTEIDVITYDDKTATVAVTWEVTEVPWQDAGTQYNPSEAGVFTFTGTLGDAIRGVAVDRMGVTPQIFVENRLVVQTVPPRPMEWLDRGVVAIPVQSGEGILVNWRLLATEYGRGLTFNVYRNGKLINDVPITTLNFIDRDGVPGDEYQVRVVQTGELSDPVEAWFDNWIDIPLQRPASRENPAIAFGAPADTPRIYYHANDMAVADVTGNGRYDILVKWEPSQQQDPGLANRHTGETIFDLYTLEGELLWRINLGINITSSAHHSSFNFFDLDLDGLAEFAIKTADGTRVFHPQADGTICDLRDEPVYIIGDPNAVWVGALQNPANDNVVNSGALGRVSNGPELFTVFNGLTGLPRSTVAYFAPYDINRGHWGDTNNNRSDRFLAAVAYTPKYTNPAIAYPTIIEVRGHYGPHFAGAYQLIDGELILVWEFHLSDWVTGGIFSNHSISIADVDRDGFDEIIFGSIVLNSDGTPRWISDGSRGTTRGTHGDALHVSVMLPDRDDFFVMTPLESPPPYNARVYNASTGEMYWGLDIASNDVGRGIAANITPEAGFEVWAGDPPGGGSGSPMYNLATGQIVEGEKPSINFRIFWDGDLLSELLDGPNNQPLSVTKFNYITREMNLIQTFTGTLSNNGTKANPGIQADIFGDWREEVIVRTNCHNYMRIYTTNIPTDFVIYTLMHDPAYRLQVNAQNSTYNQPPHLSFYLGEDIRDEVLAMQLPVPNIFLTNAPFQDTPTIPVQSVEITQDDLTLSVGETYELTFTINPADATSQDVQWSSNANEVVTVDENGIVTAISKGVATVYLRLITPPNGLFTTLEGIYDAIVITVEADEDGNLIPEVLDPEPPTAQPQRPGRPNLPQTGIAITSFILLGGTALMAGLVTGARKKKD